mgnify:CR=1 FL=1
MTVNPARCGARLDAAGWLDAAQVPEAEREEIGQAVADRRGSDQADYVRLRFIMRKPK